MPPAPSATSLPSEGTAPADQPASAIGPAPAARKLVAQPAPASQARPGSQPADDRQLLHELDHVLAAITERRARRQPLPAPTAPPLPISAPRSRSCVMPSTCPVPPATAAAPGRALRSPMPRSTPVRRHERPRTRPPARMATSAISGPPSPTCGMSWACPHTQAAPSPPAPPGCARRAGHAWPAAGPGRRRGARLRPVVPRHPGMAADVQDRPGRAGAPHGDP